MLGLFLGSFVFGLLSDKIGRRHTLLVAIITCTSGNMLGCAMPNHWRFSKYLLDCPSDSVNLQLRPHQDRSRGGRAGDDDHCLHSDHGVQRGQGESPSPALGHLVRLPGQRHQRPLLPGRGPAATLRHRTD